MVERVHCGNNVVWSLCGCNKPVSGYVTSSKALATVTIMQAHRGVVWKEAWLEKGAYGHHELLNSAEAE